MREGKAEILLRLALLLSARREGMTLEEIEEAMEVGRRTAERMRDSLRTLFDMPEPKRDEDGRKRFRLPPGSLRGLGELPMKEELIELANCAAMLRANGHHTRAAKIESLDHKVRAAMGRALSSVDADVDALRRAELTTIRVGPRPVEAPELVAQIREAIMATKAVRFRYSGGSRQGEWREVHPYGLILERENYLVGADLGSDPSELPRKFRLDRISEFDLMKNASWNFEPFDMDEYVKRSFGIYQDDVEDVVLRVLPAGVDQARRWIFHPTQQIEDNNDGSILVRFRASGMRELCWHLFTWGDQLEIVEPDRLRSTMVEQLRLSGKRYSLPQSLSPTN